MNVCEGFPSKFQIDFFFIKSYLNFGDPFAKMSVTMTLNNEKKSLVKLPIAKKETTLSEQISFIPTLYECPVNKFNDCIAQIEVNLLKKENQKRFVGDFQLNLAEYAPKANKKVFEDTQTVDLNNSSHYNGKLSFTIKMSYQMKKQIRSLSHNSFENKEIIPNIRTESPKRAISNIKYVDNRLSEQSDHKPEPIYEEKKKQRRSPDPRISIMDLENNLEFEAFHAVQSEKIEKIEKEMQTEEIAINFCEESNNNNVNNIILEEEINKRMHSSEQIVKEKENNIKALSEELAQSQNSEKVLLEKVKELEFSLKTELETKDEKILALTEEKNKIQQSYDQEKVDFLKKYNTLMEDLDKQMKKENQFQKNIRILEKSKTNISKLQVIFEEEHMGKVMNEKEIENMRIEHKNLEQYNENLKKQIGNKEKKLNELEESSSRLQEDYVKIKQKLAEVMNLIFEKGGSELMESMEALLELGVVSEEIKN